MLIVKYWDKIENTPNESEKETHAHTSCLILSESPWLWPVVGYVVGVVLLAGAYYFVRIRFVRS